MGLVIATFIIAAVFVGYHASQEHEPEGKTHSIPAESQIPLPTTLQVIKAGTDQASIT